MMNNNHNNSGCGFSEQLVSYLYDESTETEKNLFEKHLQSCSMCADELASFSGVHFSINDWKLKEFDVLESPVIEIPYEKTEKTVEVSGLTSSWLSGMRNLFSLSPAWSLATAIMTVLIVCVGIVLFAFNSRPTNDIAITNKSQIKPVISPGAEKTPPSSNANVNQTNSSDKQPKPIAAPTPQKPEIAVSSDTNSTNERVVKVSNNPSQPQKPDNVRKNKEVKNTNKNREIAPKVVEDDEEDDSLRLAEIFDEIDTK